MADSCFSDDNLLVNWRLLDDNILELIAKSRRLLPWLITGCDRVDGRLFYISFTDDKLHSIVVPALKENKSVELGIVSCQGWLVLEGQENSYAISLLNPLTGAHVHLPEAPKQLFTRRIQYNIPFDPLHPEATMNYVEIQYLIHQMAMSSDPLSTTECIIVVISAVSKALVSLRMGADGSSWLLMNNESKYEDVVFFLKYFYAVNCLGEVYIFSGINLNKVWTITSPSMELNKADWKLTCTSTARPLLFQRVSDCEGYISFKDRKLPFYKTRSVNVYKLFRGHNFGEPPVKFVEINFRNSVLFYGISSPPYSFLQLFSGMPNLVYIAGEHVEMPDDDKLIYYMTMPQKFDKKNATVKPLLPQGATHSMSFWHMPQPF
ncbi:hypothetical protein ZIOFF_023407 [Zingiber officinale]|uniref:KIB1-4 beta-propeller domain-containing protein n=1 Tax=Zingiber officinale TaxID=94328 RepID=A0A8J5GSG9_ZINOF|nr:hypothetical protein ZIOFF_023407 [Zingiber officinale]